MTNHVMVDLETLDTAASAVVVSIGAVVFNEETILNEFYSVLDIEDQVRKGRTLSTSTIRWWMHQSEEARAVFKDHGTKANISLEELNRFLHKSPVWGNGADFDNVILRDLYRSYTIVCPWSYRDNRCYRTLVALTKVDPIMRVGTHHNALDDARYQAQMAILMLKEINGRSKIEGAELGDQRDSAKQAQQPEGSSSDAPAGPDAVS